MYQNPQVTLHPVRFWLSTRTTFEVRIALTQKTLESASRKRNEKPLRGQRFPAIYEWLRRYPIRHPKHTGWLKRKI